MSGRGPAAGVAVLVLAACGSSAPGGLPRGLLAQSRPIGRGAGFETRASGPVPGPCRRRLGQRFGVHVELFARDRVVLVPAGIGTPPPRRLRDGRLDAARCYGALVTLEPTGLVLVAPGRRLSVADLFRAWGQPLGCRRLGAFPAPAGTVVRAFVDGRRWRGPVGRVPLRRHAEIVLEVAPFVPPHSSYTFPPGT